jgi:hypothetical protein
MCYEPPAINFHLGETPPREPQGGGSPVRQMVFSRASLVERKDSLRGCVRYLTLPGCSNGP